MERMSNREAQLQLARQSDEMNRPSLTDYYLMKIAAIVSSFSGKAYSPEEMKIEFTQVPREDTGTEDLDIEDLSRLASESSQTGRVGVLVQASKDPKRKRK